MVTTVLALQSPTALVGSVAAAVLPLTVLFLVFQALFLDLPRRELLRILTGTLIASAGLYLFLLGVGVGFLPMGSIIGEAIGQLGQPWLLGAAGVVLGYVTTLGEPSVRILADQVEDASSGAIRSAWVVGAVCVGVAVATGLGLLRILYGIPILYLLVPGYLVVIVGVWVSEQSFTAVAIDSGGVATGPLANSFLLALATGTSVGTGAGDPLVSGLGLVALVALAPMLSVMALGLLVARRSRPKE